MPRAGHLPTPRTDFAAATFGANWVIHGGRVLSADGVLGDTYVFHFATAEWARLDAESDTDPRFGHAGRVLHSSTFRLNVSVFINWRHDFPPVY